ncbi:MAG: hypothetical protein HPY76_10175 [Anaerolineae bacterium]|jgi:hypothetical protein|nr:hypothetical protein [Anaerolineae bacterium]
MKKIDFKKQDKHLYHPGGSNFTLVDVPPMPFVMIDGSGDPNTAPAYQSAVSVLYTISYKLKFMSKQESGMDYVVPPLEGLWWVMDMNQFSVERKSDWQWTMMIRQPDWITPKIYQQACEQVTHKKSSPDLSGLRMETYHEGLSVQIMHIGPYSAEGSLIHRMHYEYMPANALLPTGKHHEIYLSDPRKSMPTKLKMILRQPVQRLE